MSKTRVFSGVTSSVWREARKVSGREQGTTYVPPDGDQGTSTTPTPVGPVVLGFEFNSTQSTATYTIRSKPFIVSEDQIWSAIEKTIQECQRANRTE